jgi:hypothetical protein
LTDNTTLPVARFLETLEIVFREGTHLAYSWKRVFSQPIDAAWVRRLDASPQRAEMLEAFVSRFGRMQDFRRSVASDRGGLYPSDPPGLSPAARARGGCGGRWTAPWLRFRAVLLALRRASFCS